MSDTLAILGAGSFVGARLVEKSVAAGGSDIVPVVRSCRSLARLSKFGVQPRWGDVSRTESIRPAICGCSVVLNLTIGDPLQMAANMKAICDACAAEKVRLLIHMSSAEVFGRAENPQLNDDSEPDLRHWMAYARGKAQAELVLRERMRGAPFTIVVLRPGLVWGPRSPWTAEPAQDLMDNRAFLVNGGNGICNLIYIDNLISSIAEVMHHPRPPSGFYNIADPGTITWADYYRELAQRLGLSFDRVVRLQPGDYAPSLMERLREWRHTKLIRCIEGAIPAGAKPVIQNQIRRALRFLNSSSVELPSQPRVTRSLWHLQLTRHKLPTAKFRQTFGNLNEYTFRQAMDLTCAWLRFAGFALPALGGGRP
jgi:2-alkyl-3-oxoalkanoate reductase